MDLKSAKVSKTKRRSLWCDGDVKMLMELWADRASDLRRAKRNGHIYKDISEQMHHKFSPEEVHVKIRNFTQKYREEKKEMGPSGGSPSTWKYYNDVHRIIGCNAANSAEVLESFLFENVSDANCQPSPEPQPMQSPSPVSKPLPSPVWLSSPSSPLSPLDITASTSAVAASSSTGKKRNHLGEVVKIMKEQNAMLKSVVDESKTLSNEIANAIREQNQTSKEFLNLMKSLIDKF